MFGIEDIKEAGRGGREQEEAESKKKEYQCVRDRNPKQERKRKRWDAASSSTGNSIMFPEIKTLASPS